ncbi:MAG: hypothetical protein D6769_01080 [Methanobacteriota archaeon]|nr:MAG: hypothetical protein D6769_01080 [Euryarchaeota archaeon]
MKKKDLMFVALLVIIGTLAYVIAFGNPLNKAPSGKYSSFAQCLTDNGAVMYGTDWCPHCKNQKAMFGDAFANINYVNCDNDKKACEDAGVQGYPTWHIKGQVLVGTQPLDVLASTAGCELPN